MSATLGLQNLLEAKNMSDVSGLYQMYEIGWSPVQQSYYTTFGTGLGFLFGGTIGKRSGCTGLSFRLHADLGAFILIIISRLINIPGHVCEEMDRAWREYHLF